MGTMRPITKSIRGDMTVSFRSVEIADAAAVLSFTHLAMRSTDQVRSPDELPTHVSGEEAFIRSFCDGPTSLLMLAQVEREIVGLLGLIGHAHRRMGHTVELGMVLGTTWRGRGIGSAMMEAGLDWASANPGIERVYLSVYSTNTLGLKLYRRFGFVEEGRRRGQVRLARGDADEILMARWVR